MSRRPFAVFRMLVAICLLAALGPANTPANAQDHQPNPANFTDARPTAAPAPNALGGSIPAAQVLGRFPNTWHGSSVGLTYNPISDTVRYGHEGQATNPATLWDIDANEPYSQVFSITLSTVNPGWPAALNDRDGLEFDTSTNTYFVTDFQGDLNARDDNLIEIAHDGTILNAWELDGGNNDSSDASAINTVIDIAIVPGATSRYFISNVDNAGTVREVALTRQGLFQPNTWSTVGTCTVPGGDNLGIDYDAEFGTLYHTFNNSELIVITDLECNPLGQFTCDGAGTLNSGITKLEGSLRQEVWVTDFNSNVTTRCAVPILTLTKIASTTPSCDAPVSEVYFFTEVTFCFTITNTSNPDYTGAYTFTTHSLNDAHLGELLTEVPYELIPGASFTYSTTTVLTSTITNSTAIWTASVGPDEFTASANGPVAVLKSPPPLCTTYAWEGPSLPLPDNTTVTATLMISDELDLFDVNTLVNFNHTWLADVSMTLVSPSGAQTVLVNQIGGNSDNFTNTLFDDQATRPLTATVAPYTGRFQPRDPLSVHNGQPSAGTWSLVMRDNANGDTGLLNAWSIELCEPPTGALELVHTLATTPGECGPTSAITTTSPVTVYSCYTITNTGNYTLPFHTLIDEDVGLLLDEATYLLGPGATISTVDLNLEIAHVITQTGAFTQSFAGTWSVDVPELISATGTATATVTVEAEVTVYQLMLPFVVRPSP